MIVRKDIKKFTKFANDAKRKPSLSPLFDSFCEYSQLAEASNNAHELSTIPWRWRKIHKLSGNRSNQYAFGISPKHRTTCYGNDKKPLPLNQVTELEIYEFIEDYH